jgi:hypothetical protein
MTFFMATSFALVPEQRWESMNARAAAQYKTTHSTIIVGRVWVAKQANSIANFLAGISEDAVYLPLGLFIVFRVSVVS